VTREERNYKSKIHMRRCVSPVYRERRAKLIVYMGGVCEKCGLEYDGANGCLFAFHHPDERKKVFALTVATMGKSWAELTYEARKTQLLCHNCHSPLHSEEY
jgi:hypothetical protein